MKKHLILFLLLVISISVKSQYHTKIVKAEFETTISKPIKILKVNAGHYFIDFGKAYFGTVLIKAKQDQNDQLVFHIGEKLSGTSRIDRDPGGTIRYQSVKIGKLEADKVTTIEMSAFKRNTNPPAIMLPDSFGVVMPFRYCEIENLQIPIDDIEIWQKAFHYKFYDNSSAFTSSDTILNAIWDLCKHSIKATSFSGYYIDGDRERIPYEGDAYINQLSHYCVDSVYSLAKRTNEYFIEHPTWPTEWILHTALLFYYDFLYTGDLHYITRYYDKLKAKTLMELAREDGLITTKSTKLNDDLMRKLGFSNPNSRIKDIVDWPPGERDGYEMAAINTVVNSFYCENLRIMSVIAGATGNKNDSIYYRNRSNQVKNSINQKLFDTSRGIYIDGEGSNHASLHANMFPLVFNIVPEEHTQTVVDFIKSRGMACSVYGAQYLLEGLFKNDESVYAVQLITDTTNDRNWWNMIRTGSTITLETWDMKYKPNLDWNHAWGAAPANIITRYMWGITPEKPGFTTVQINPKLANLSFSEIMVPTKNGIINAQYKLGENRNKFYEIELPENMSGQFILHQERDKMIYHNNRVITGDKEILKLESGINIIEIKN
ncbi:trehalase family glycosidase [Bacteroidota bacterium]